MTKKPPTPAAGVDYCAAVLTKRVDPTCLHCRRERLLPPPLCAFSSEASEESASEALH
jgi:hypothetical protein